MPGKLKIRLVAVAGQCLLGLTGYSEQSKQVARVMQEEAEISINGVKLSDSESMTVRVAIDTLANVLAESLEETEGRELTEVYLKSLGSIQTLLEQRQTRKQ
jgi:hypothetical protein